MFESYVLLSRGVFRLVWTGFSQTGLDVSGQQGYLGSKEEAEEIRLISCISCKIKLFPDQMKCSILQHWPETGLSSPV